MEFIALFSEYELIVMFVAAFFLGEFVIVPVLYFAVGGTFDIGAVFLVFFLASVMADFFWYIVGRFIPRAKLFKVPILSFFQKGLKRLHLFYDRHGERCVFISRFIIGTRITVQILAGLHDMPWWKFLKIDGLAVLLLMLGLTTLALLVDVSISSFENMVAYTQIGFLIFAILIVCLTVVFKSILKFLLANEK